MDNHRQEAGVEAPQDKKISELFREEKVTGAILSFWGTRLSEIKNGAL